LFQIDRAQKSPDKQEKKFHLKLFIGVPTSIDDSDGNHWLRRGVVFHSGIVCLSHPDRNATTLGSRSDF
jgi:hypothetical protein